MADTVVSNSLPLHRIYVNTTASKALRLAPPTT